MSQSSLGHNSLIEVLETNRLLRSPDEVVQFEQTLESLTQSPDIADYPAYTRS